MKNHQSYEENQMFHRVEARWLMKANVSPLKQVYAKSRELLKTNFVFHEIPEDCSM